MQYEFNEGDRVYVKGTDYSGIVLEYMGDFDFPKVRVLMDGLSEPGVYYADSLLTVPEPRDLAAEVRRLRRGIDAVRAEAERYKKIGDDSVKEPGLSWYQEDRYHNQREAIGMAADDILEALEKGLGEDE
jgi:hypothetical protein